MKAVLAVLVVAGCCGGAPVASVSVKEWEAPAVERPVTRPVKRPDHPAACEKIR